MSETATTVHAVPEALNSPRVQGRDTGGSSPALLLRGKAPAPPFALRVCRLSDETEWCLSVCLQRPCAVPEGASTFSRTETPMYRERDYIYICVERLRERDHQESPGVTSKASCIFAWLELKCFL